MTGVAPKSFLFDLDAAAGVATLTLNRPERLNALTFEVYAELRDTFAALDAEPRVKAVILTGAGRGFCSGGDVEDIIGALFGRHFPAITLIAISALVEPDAMVEIQATAYVGGAP